MPLIVACLERVGEIVNVDTTVDRHSTPKECVVCENASETWIFFTPFTCFHDDMIPFNSTANYYCSSFSKYHKNVRAHDFVSNILHCLDSLYIGCSAESTYKNLENEMGECEYPSMVCQTFISFIFTIVT